MKRTAIAIVCGALLLPAMLPSANAADANDQFAIRNAGAASCQQFMEARQQQTSAYVNFVGWIDGYLTAVNQFTPQTFDVAPYQSTELIASLAHGICQQRSNEPFGQIIIAMAQQIFQPGRLEQSSEAVTVQGQQRNYQLYREVVRRIQQALQEQGHYNGGIDGQFGPGTRTALEAFQRQQNLQPTGDPDQNTLWRLLSSG
jgi:hypothetical protein